MTGTVRRVDWAALEASVGSCVLFALLCSAPFLVRASYGLWLVGPAVGVVAGPTCTCGGTATASPALTPTRPAFRGEASASSCRW